ncbi:MAG: transglutaminase domain-containing protein [Chloroflexi bacterium]|nr:transglutaminase domain-containing protein [Chloroflexota bacterium]
MVATKQNIYQPSRGNSTINRLKRLAKRWREVIPPFLHTGYWLKNWPEWLSLALVFLTLAVAVHCVEQAEWVIFQPSLILTLFIAMLVTAVTARSRLPRPAKHSVILLLGAIVAGWQLSQIPNIQPWWRELVVNRPNQSAVHFITLLVLSTWIIGYISAWLLVRRQNIWVAISLGAAVIIINLGNLPVQHYTSFPLYVLAAILVIGQKSLARHQNNFRQYGTKYPGRGLVYFAVAVVSIGVLLTSITLALPDVRLTQMAPTVNTKAFRLKAEKYWLNIFAAIPGKWDILRSDKQAELPFGYSPYQDGRVQFVIDSNESDYWRTRRYHTYLSWGWSSNSTIENMFYPGKQVYAAELPLREELTYSVTNKLKTDVLPTTGEFRNSQLPVLLQTLSHPGDPESPEKRKDVISVVAPRMLLPDEQYTMTVGVVQVTSEELSRAGTDYDEWVTRYYLQLPDTLPKRVRDLAQRLTLLSKNPYEKVTAITDYFPTFSYRYSRDRNTPPPGRDAVDYFLFSNREGDCTYFASATAVLLRAAGVPARISSGYLLKEQADSSGQFVLRAKDYHARAEAYFPGYGWIELETTPSPEILAASSPLSGNILDFFEDLSPMETAGIATEPMDTFLDFQASGGQLYRRNRYFPVVGTTLLVVIALGTAGIVFYQRWIERVRRTGDASYIYAKMCSLASQSGAGPMQAETPTEYSARLISAFPEQSHIIGDITGVYVSSRFGPRKDLDSAQRVKIEKSWVQLYPALLKRILRLQRATQPRSL